MLVNSSPAPVRLRKNVIVFVSLGPDYTPADSREQILERTAIDTFLHFNIGWKTARTQIKPLGRAVAAMRGA
ncbi:hypothetical protein [Pseudomonas sp. KB-10]|jgi:hypothetical protein|uniref:hypothetical protein n=1 Tax=Pseudomonas sp. KB-10 TaxID=2292264 RepID=UPI001BAF5B49|nr:hypothetical protein [Pseudomonas sp. KB-10]